MDWQKHKKDLGDFYRNGFDDLKDNMSFGWPFFAALALIWLISGFLLWLSEKGEPCAKIKTFGDGLYCTWITMTTVGFGDFYPTSILGKIIVSIDAFFGLVLIGLLVWLITSSFSKH